MRGGMSARRFANAVSILYLRCGEGVEDMPALTVASFNSLFEMPGGQQTGWRHVRSRVSILYLRCRHTAPVLCPAGGMQKHVFQFSI